MRRFLYPVAISILEHPPYLWGILILMGCFIAVILLDLKEENDRIEQEVFYHEWIVVRCMNYLRNTGLEEEELKACFRMIDSIVSSFSDEEREWLLHETWEVTGTDAEEGSISKRLTKEVFDLWERTNGGSSSYFCMAPCVQDIYRKITEFLDEPKEAEDT